MQYVLVVFKCISVACEIFILFFCVLIVTIKMSSILEDGGEGSQADKVLNINITDKKNLNKNTAASQVYIYWLGGHACVHKKYSKLCQDLLLALFTNYILWQNHFSHLVIFLLSLILPWGLKIPSVREVKEVCLFPVSSQESVVMLNLVSSKNHPLTM